MTNNKKLQEYFEFTESDLEENRQGHITEDQELIVKDKTNTFNNRAFIILFAFIFVYFVILSISENTKNIFETSFFLNSGIVVGITIMILFFRSIGRNDLTVNQVEGKVNFVWVEEKYQDSPRSSYSHSTLTRLKMRVKKVSFDVDEELMDIIDQGDACRFYYTSGGDILSAEFIKGSEK